MQQNRPLLCLHDCSWIPDSSNSYSMRPFLSPCCSSLGKTGSLIIHICTVIPKVRKSELLFLCIFNSIIYLKLLFGILSWQFCVSSKGERTRACQFYRGNYISSITIPFGLVGKYGGNRWYTFLHAFGISRHTNTSLAFPITNRWPFQCA